MAKFIQIQKHRSTSRSSSQEHLSDYDQPVVPLVSIEREWEAEDKFIAELDELIAEVGREAVAGA